MALKRLSLFASIFCLLFLVSCGKKKLGYDAIVALDPTWYSIELPGRESALTAFTCELIEAIGSEENLNIGVFQRSWSNLMLGLQEGDYQAICTSVQPYLFYEKLYCFSDIYLITGPVLVVAIDSPLNSLMAMKGQEVGVLQGSSNSIFLERYPDIIQRTYNSIQQALDDVSQKVIDAAILDHLTAEAFIRDLYHGQLKIGSPPLKTEGIRVVGLQEKTNEFIQKFNRGLDRIKAKGIYNKLAQKWGFPETSYNKK